MQDVINVIIFASMALSLWGMARYFWNTFRAQRLGGALGASSVAWPATSGKIITSEVTRDSDSGWYLPAIAYEYAVGDASFTGSQIAFKILYPSWQKAARKIVDKYPAGSAARVFYDPADPRRCVLEQGSRAGWFGPWLSLPLTAVAALGAAALAVVTVVEIVQAVDNWIHPSPSVSLAH